MTVRFGSPSVAFTLLLLLGIGSICPAQPAPDGEASSAPAVPPAAGQRAMPVHVGNFIRAETDLYFAKTVALGAFGKLQHSRSMTPIAAQTVARTNRDTLSSSGVFDLDAAPVTVTLPDPGKRFMSMQVVSEDHFTTEVVYAPGRFVYEKEKVGTRYLFLIVRTLANPGDPDDVAGAHRLQDAIQVEQARAGAFVAPDWDRVAQGRVRAALVDLGALGGLGVTFGTQVEVDPVSHLIGTAVAWGGSPDSAAIYRSVVPRANDGKTIHTLTVRDVPVDGFWSISLYDAAGFFAKNDLDAYSINNLTAKPNRDGSITVQFGGCVKETRNCLPILPGWNYTVRMYRPRPALRDGSWTFPLARPVG